MDDEQFAASMRDLTMLLDPDIIGLVRAGDTGLIASHCICIPDISPAVRRAHGRLGALDQLGLVLGRRRWQREALLVVQGTHHDHEGEGLLCLLSRHVLFQLVRKGYRTLRVTFIVDGNRGSSRQVERVGGRPLHGTTLYRREVTVLVGDAAPQASVPTGDVRVPSDLPWSNRTGAIGLTRPEPSSERSRARDDPWR